MTATRKPEPAAPLFSLPSTGRALPMLHVPEGHDCVVALKALGEETRVRIVGLLIDEPLEVNEIAKRLGVSQYNVSKHLRILREAGLLEVAKDGRRHLYALPEAMRTGAAGGGILDLGCCRFQFDGTSAGARATKAGAAGRKQPRRTSRHTQAR
jgi:DNA-binding transcriptional ArsR family regulator